MSGPDYSEKDLFYYGGLMGGIAGTYLILGQTGVESTIIRLIAGFVVGLGLGHVLETAYRKSKKPDP